MGGAHAFERRGFNEVDVENQAYYVNADPMAELDIHGECVQVQTQVAQLGFFTDFFSFMVTFWMRQERRGSSLSITNAFGSAVACL